MGPAFCFLLFGASLGLVACGQRVEPSRTSSRSTPDASSMAASVKPAEPTVSAAPSAAPSADAALSSEPYIVLMEEIGAIHTRNTRDCPKMAQELTAYFEAHEASIRAPDKKVAVAIEADPAQKARMKAAMTAIMDDSAPCGSVPAFTKLMEKLRAEHHTTNP